MALRKRAAEAALALGARSRPLPSLFILFLPLLFYLLRCFTLFRFSFPQKKQNKKTQQKLSSTGASLPCSPLRRRSSGPSRPRSEIPSSSSGVGVSPMRSTRSRSVSSIFDYYCHYYMMMREREREREFLTRKISRKKHQKIITNFSGLPQVREGVRGDQGTRRQGVQPRQALGQSLVEGREGGGVLFRRPRKVRPRRRGDGRGRREVKKGRRNVLSERVSSLSPSLESSFFCFFFL